MNTKTKPALHLINPGTITGERLADLFEKLTGEKSTPEQIAAMQAELDKVEAEPDAKK